MTSPPTARAEIEGLQRRYAKAYESGDADDCAAAFTEDARLDHPYGPPAEGIAAIAGLHRDWTSGDERNKAVWVIELTCAAQEGHGLIGWSAEIGPPDALPPQKASGVSMIALRRTSEGWRIHRLALVPRAL